MTITPENVTLYTDHLQRVLKPASYAQLVSRIHSWCQTNQKSDKKRYFKNGYWWTIITEKQLADESGLSAKTIQRARDSLKNKGIIFAEQLNRGGDRTYFYRINYEKLMTLDQKIMSVKPHIYSSGHFDLSTGHNDQFQPDILTDSSYITNYQTNNPFYPLSGEKQASKNSAMQDEGINHSAKQTEMIQATHSYPTDDRELTRPEKLQAAQGGGYVSILSVPNVVTLGKDGTLVSKLLGTSKAELKWPQPESKFIASVLNFLNLELQSLRSGNSKSGNSIEDIEEIEKLKNMIEEDPTSISFSAREESRKRSAFLSAQQNASEKGVDDIGTYENSIATTYNYDEPLRPLAGHAAPVRSSSRKPRKESLKIPVSEFPLEEFRKAKPDWQLHRVEPEYNVFVKHYSTDEKKSLQYWRKKAERWRDLNKFKTPEMKANGASISTQAEIERKHRESQLKKHQQLEQVAQKDRLWKQQQASSERT